MATPHTCYSNVCCGFAAAANPLPTPNRPRGHRRRQPPQTPGTSIIYPQNLASAGNMPAFTGSSPVVYQTRTMADGSIMTWYTPTGANWNSNWNSTDQWTPGTFPPQPFGTPVPIQLHPHLIPNPNNVYFRQVDWDIARMPSTARRTTGRGLTVPLDLDQIAVSPKATHIHLLSSFETLQGWMQRWGPIIILKNEITIRDIFEAIYTYFQVPLTEDEVAGACRNDDDEARLTHAAYMRIQSGDQIHAVEVQNGFRRVDVVGTHRMFAGIIPLVYSDGTWKAFLQLQR